MDQRDLLIDAFGRIEGTFAAVVDGLDPEMLNHRPRGTGNPIGWLLWHLARITDDHVADLAGTEQVWQQGWQQRFDLPLPPDDHGFGHSHEQVDAVRITDPGLLTGYHRDVHAATLSYLDRVDGDELGRVVDTAWDPPVTAGARLVSLLGECHAHLGQAAYLKGLLR